MLTRSGENHGGRWTVISFICLVLGCAVNIYSYGSVSPVLVTGIVYIIVYTVVMATPLGGKPERRIFNRTFSVGFFMAGVAAIYANQFQDQSQLYSDAGGFFALASKSGTGISLLELKIMHEGSLGIVIWGFIYDFFAALGFERARYVGISLNLAAVAMSGVFGIKIARQIFGDDEYRFHRRTLLVSMCGLFFLFTGIHLRDSMILLAVTALIFVWLYFLAQPDIGARLAQVTLGSLVAGAYFGYLRQEFVYVPVAMGIAALAALYVGRVDRNRRLVIHGLLLVGAFMSLFMVLYFGEGLLRSVDAGYIGYKEDATLENTSSSLGMTLIVNQMMPVRLVLGSIYLYVFPIPFWSGFQLESAYQLFKSLNVVYFYFVIPLLYMAGSRLIKNKKLRTPNLLFLAFTSIGFTLAVAGTSLETRHLGVFLIPVLVLALLPDLRIPHQRRRYNFYLSIFLSGVLTVHLAWIALKVL